MFDKAEIKKWRKAVHKELRPLGMASEEPTYRAAMVLAAVMGFGSDVSVVAQVSGQTPEFVTAVIKRARANRLLIGQTLRAAWNSRTGLFALLLDAMVGVGDVARSPDPKRSAAAKARKRGPERKPRVKRAVVPVGSVYTPKIVNSDPLYGLPEWDKKKQ